MNASTSKSSSRICSGKELKVYLSIFLTVLATVFLWFSAFDCNFFRVPFGFATVQPPPQFSIDGGFVLRGYGLWTVQGPPTPVDNGRFGVGFAPGTCQLYRSVEDSSVIEDQLFDSTFRFARAVSMMAMILSLPVIIMASSNLFLRSVTRSYRFLQVMVTLFVSFLTIIEFIALSSRMCADQIQCSMSVSGAYGIVAAVLLFLGSFATYFVDSAEDEEFSAAIREQQERPSLEIKDGTVDGDVDVEGQQVVDTDGSSEADAESKGQAAAAAATEDATSVTCTDVDGEMEPIDDRMETISLDDEDGAEQNK